MQVLETVEIQLQWSDLDNLHVHARNDEVRVAGVAHVSQVIRHLAIKANTYTNDDRDDDMPLRILLGLAFEEYAARLYPDMHWQPGQIEVDGIVGSPDGFTNGNMSVFPIDVCVDEFKYTGKSMRVKGGKADELKDIRTEWMWIQQGMSYVNLIRRMLPDMYRNVNRCRFHICWKYGNYTYPMLEKYVRYLVEFSEAELRGNWALLQANKNEIELR